MSSLRTRLVLGLLAGITLFLALTGVAVHAVVESQLSEALDTSLEAVLRSSVTDVARERDRQDPPGRRRPPRKKSLLGWLLPEQEDVLLQAWDENGETIFRSDSLGEDELPRVAQDLEALEMGDLSTAQPYRDERLLGESQEPVRLMAFRYQSRERPPPDERGPRAQGLRGRLARRASGATGDEPRDPLDRHGPPPYEPEPTPRVVELVVGHGTTGIAGALSELRWLLVMGWLVSSAGCAGLVSWIVHVGLRPLQRLREQMGRHAGDDLQASFSLPDAPKELAPVVDQLNGLMGRISETFEREQAFASDAAHELRTPIAGLRSTLELALSRPRESDAWKRTAEQSLAIALEMQSLVETLLALARVSRASTRAPDTVTMSSLLARALETHAALATEREQRWQVDVPSGASLTTDAALLGRVVDNLVENAVAYAPRCSALRVELLDAGEHWALEVSNPVQGAHPDLPRRAFEAFWRADSSRGETGRHAGLGLALCRKIIEALGGSIRGTLDGDVFSVLVQLPKR